jgi:non-specific serine/threonine protein kinase/serine/threonine-protein kinase
MRLVVDTSPPKASSAAPASVSLLPYEPRRALKGDLDAIILRAMHKDPERRYGSAEELAEDLARYLEGEPVLAREPSLGYVAWKLACRHKTAVVSIAVSAVIVLAALVVAIRQARVAVAERERAQQRFNDVRRLANAVVFDIHDAVAPLPGSTPVRQAIVREALQYLERLAPEASDDPALRLELARAYVQIGRVQGVPTAPNLGDRAGAMASLTKAREILTPASAAGAPLDWVTHYVEATRHLSSVLLVAGQPDRAVATAREAVGAAEAALRQDPTDDRRRTLVASSSFAAATATGWPDSLALWNRAGAVYRDMLAERPDDPQRQRNVALVEKYLGAYYTTGGDRERALEHHRRALALDEKRLARDPGNRGVQFDVAIDLANTAEATWMLGDLPQAAALYVRSLAMRTALAASDPSDALARSRMAHTHGQLARVYRQLRDFPRAVEHGRQAVAAYDSNPRQDPNDRRDLARAIWALGDVEADRGAPRQACRLFARAFDIMRALAEADRRAGAARHEDRLNELAVRAAACGVPAARAWTDARTAAPANRTRATPPPRDP